jgi:hypothetical protein
MADYRIDCVNKPDRYSPHERLTHVRWVVVGGWWADGFHAPCSVGGVWLVELYSCSSGSSSGGVKPCIGQ